MSPEILRLLQVALGIGLVIFVHEAGHFLAARACGVRVEVFSLGFGPKLFGWTRRGTLYQLALVPFGGYVRMAGEYERNPGESPPPDSLHAKNVPQRFLIYSGGVIMNVIFALVCFPLVYHFGVPAVRPVVGATIPGMPAWEARIPRGTEILSIEGREVHDFMGIPSEVAISGSKPVHMHVRYPGEADTRDIALTPRKDEHNGFYRVGMGPASDPHWTLEVDPDGPAAAAGLLSGDRVRSVRGSLPGQDPESALIQAYAANAPVTLEVERNESLIDVTVEPLWKPVEGRAVFGIEPPSHRIEAVRTAGPAQHLGLQAGDRLVSIAGKPVWRSTDLLLGLIDAPAGPLHATVRRDGQAMELEWADYKPAEAYALYDDVAFAQDLDSTVLLVRPGSAAEKAGLQTGDQVTGLNGKPAAEWADIQLAAGNAATLESPLAFAVVRGDQPLELMATAGVGAALEYGFGYRPSMYTFRADGFGKAITLGARSSLRMLREAVMTLKQMFRREISPKNLGGIVTIGQVSYQASSMGWTKLLFFLCMLSVNLAFLNVLPIPLLDGGHLFFLMIEGIKGSPVSEKIMGYSQLVGLVLILSLMVYVTYQDILRLL